MYERLQAIPLALKRRLAVSVDTEGSVLFNDALSTFSYGYMFHLTHIFINVLRKKEGNVLFNDTLNAFFKFMVIWRQTYGKVPHR